MKALFSIYESHFSDFIDRSYAHYTKKQNYSWLHPQNKNFTLIPDYLTLHQFAPTKFRSLANHALSHSPTLWETLVWPKITHTIIQKIETKYLKTLYNSYHPGHTPPKEIFALLRALFQKFDPIIIKATFTDLYFFLNELLKSTADYLDLPQDIYGKEKSQHLNDCLKIYTDIAQEICTHPRGIEIAVHLAIRANWIDCVEDDISPFLTQFPGEISHLLDQTDDGLSYHHLSPHYQIAAFKNALSTPKKIVYELDNAGEVVIDMILIECLLQKGHQITLVAKDNPVLNDITRKELCHLLTHPHLNHLQSHPSLSILDAHTSIAGKYLPHATSAYKKAYHACDFLILKGQGNFQTMPMGHKMYRKYTPYPYAKPKFFLFGLKAPFIQSCVKKTLQNTHSIPPIHTPMLLHFQPQL